MAAGSASHLGFDVAVGIWLSMAMSAHRAVCVVAVMSQMRSKKLGGDKYLGRREQESLTMPLQHDAEMERYGFMVMNLAKHEVPQRPLSRFHLSHALMFVRDESRRATSRPALFAAAVLAVNPKVQVLSRCE